MDCFSLFIQKFNLCLVYLYSSYCRHNIVRPVVVFFVLDPWCRNGVEGRIVNSGLTKLSGGGFVVNGATHSGFNFFFKFVARKLVL